MLGYDRFTFDSAREDTFDKELDLSRRGNRERSREPDHSDSSSYCSHASENSLSPGLVPSSPPTSITPPSLPSVPGRDPFKCNFLIVHFFIAIMSVASGYKQVRHIFGKIEII